MFSQLGSQASGLLQNNKQFSFDPIAQKARSNFQSQTIPSIAERFTSLGNGAQNSSAFQGALTGAGQNLDESLAALESQFGLQQQGQNNQQLMSLLSLLLQPQYENAYFPGQPGLLQGLAGAGGQALGSLGGYGALNYILGGNSQR